MGEKFLQMQQQMRHDNEDLQDYLRDLKNWETDIKRKDEALRQDGETAAQDPILPPIRNQTTRTSKERKKKKRKPATKQSEQTKPPENGSSSRIRAYDYGSWDKFDVDKACAQLDSDEDDTTPSPRQDEGDGDGMESGPDREEEKELVRQRLIQQASMEKDKGNALFKEGRYADAVVCYTAGMEADPTNAILPANRAMAHLKLKRFEDAEKDCDMSISLDCTYIKAYARRATARFELGKLEEAKKDYQQVLNLEPGNKQAATEIKRINRITKEAEDTERQKRDGVYNIIQAVQKPVHLRSKKPLKRMVIEEIGTGSGDDEDTGIQTTPPQNPRDTDHGGDRLRGPSQPAEPSPVAIDHPKKNVAHKQSRIQETRKPPSEDRVPDPAKSKLVTDGTPPIPSKTNTPPNIPGTPSSSYQLQSDWKQLQKFPDELFRYFKRIAPQSYKQLLQQSLDSTLLMQILNLLKDQYIKHNEPVYETLEGLSLVKRFDMNVMFMSSQDKEVVQELFSYIEQSGTTGQQELNKLRKKYGL